MIPMCMKELNHKIKKLLLQKMLSYVPNVLVHEIILNVRLKTREGVREVFEYAAKVALDRHSHDKCFCNWTLL